MHHAVFLVPLQHRISSAQELFITTLSDLINKNEVPRVYEYSLAVTL